MGNSLALYNPPTRVAEEFAMIDCISGGRLIAGFPVGTPMDTCLRLRSEPVDAAGTLPRRRTIWSMRAWTETGHLRVQRPLQPAALREHLAAPDPATASADLGAGRRLGGDLAVVRGDGLRVLLSVLLRLQGRPRDDGWVSGTKWSRLGKDRNPYRAGFLQFVGVGESRQHAFDLYARGRPSISTAAACMSIRASRRRPATPAKATQRAGHRKPGPRPRRHTDDVRPSSSRARWSDRR